jgi:hypothetical protein
MAEREGEGKGDRKVYWLRVVGVAAGVVVAIGTLVLALIGGHEVISRDAVSLVVQCQSLPARASLDPLVTGLLKSAEQAYSKTVKQVERSQDFPLELERRSALRELESSTNWKRDGYVACHISNQGSKPAQDVRLSVERSEKWLRKSGQGYR